MYFVSDNFSVGERNYAVKKKHMKIRDLILSVLQHMAISDFGIGQNNILVLNCLPPIWNIFY